MAAERGILRNNSEGEGGRERKRSTVGGVLESDRVRVNGVTHYPKRVVGQAEDAGVFDQSGAVESYVAGGIVEAFKADVVKLRFYRAEEEEEGEKEKEKKTEETCSHGRV